MLGLVIGVVVLAASTHDNEAGIALLDQAAERCGMRPEKILADQGLKDAVIIHGAVEDNTVEVVRRLARDYDHRPDNAASRVVGPHRRHAPPPHHPSTHLAGRRGVGRMNVSELLRRAAGTNGHASSPAPSVLRQEQSP